MDFIDLMTRRVSSRVFTKEKISEAELEQVLRAGEMAPVGSNEYRNIHLTVVQDAYILRRLAEAAVLRRKDRVNMAKLASSVSNAAEILNESKTYDPFYNAPAVIFVSHRKQDLQPGIEWANVSCLVSCMHLAATELGLGSCFMWFVLESMRLNPALDHTDLLCLPDDFEPLMGLALGHIAQPLQEREWDMNRISVDYL